MKNPLFTQTQTGAIDTPNRVVMAPATRSRSEEPGDVPTPLMAECYAQRANAGFIITEATQISAQGQGYSFTPGICTDGQVADWPTITDAVRAARGRIVSQLWHVGRMSPESFHPDGQCRTALTRHHASSTPTHKSNRGVFYETLIIHSHPLRCAPHSNACYNW